MTCVGPHADVAGRCRNLQIVAAPRRRSLGSVEGGAAAQMLREELSELVSRSWESLSVCVPLG